MGMSIHRHPLGRFRLQPHLPSAVGRALLTQHGLKRTTIMHRGGVPQGVDEVSVGTGTDRDDGKSHVFAVGGGVAPVLQVGMTVTVTMGYIHRRRTAPLTGTAVDRHRRCREGCRLRLPLPRQTISRGAVRTGLWNMTVRLGWRPSHLRYV